MKMLYIMHVDWLWIKQRPHFIAEELAKYCDLTLIYPFSYKRDLLVKRYQNEIHFPIRPLFNLPFSGRLRNWKIFNGLNNFFLMLQLKLLDNNFDYIWLTFPTIFKNAKKVFPQSKFIYDCMDDCVGFASSERLKASLYSSEVELLNNCHKVFVSSRNLANVVKMRGCLDPILINNGISKSILLHCKKCSNGDSKVIKNLNLLYIGTISSWFDFPLILRLLGDFENITISLVGPREVSIPEHPRLHYKGILAHDSLVDFVKKFDVLIMPFVLNELVLSVDPVKIYEYISFNKHIIAIFYPEMEKFRDFVNFYTDYTEFKSIISKLLEDISLNYSFEMADSFLQNNTWEKRGEKIAEEIRLG